MGPAPNGRIGSTVAVLLATLIVAIIVAAMVIGGGGPSHPIVTAVTDGPAVAGT